MSVGCVLRGEGKGKRGMLIRDVCRESVARKRAWWRKDGEADVDLFLQSWGAMFCELFGSVCDVLKVERASAVTWSIGEEVATSSWWLVR